MKSKLFSQCQSSILWVSHKSQDVFCPTNSTVIYLAKMKSEWFILKMESVSKNTIFGLKIMVKSGLENLFLKFLQLTVDYFPLLHKSAQNHKFSNKNNHLPAWRDFKIFFSRPLFTIIFRPKIVFLETDSIFRVKTIYESVK